MKEIANIDFKELQTNDFIESIADNSSEGMDRARIHFKNGHELSVIRGEFSYGGSEGLFEIMPSHDSLFDTEDSYDTVAGHLTPERVEYYINKIGAMKTSCQLQ